MELHEFVMKAPVPLIILSGPQHIFTLANKAYENFVSRDVIGKTVNEIFNFEEAEHFLPMIDDVYSSGIPFSGRELFFPLLNDDGIVKNNWVNVDYYPFFGNNGKITGVLAFITDVTATVEAKKIIEISEMHYRELASNLEKESDMREIFVSTLTHDLRTPLTVAKLSAQALERKFESSPSLQKIGKRISASMDRADGMIADLLDASMVKAGEELPIRIVPCCMNAIISSVIDELGSMHGNRFKINLAEEINGFWDNTGIRRVLENLLLNGIKYGNENSPITIDLRSLNQVVSINVHNEGPQINPEELKTLFDRFKRLKSAEETYQKGWDRINAGKRDH